MQFDIAGHHLRVDAFIMIMYGDRENLFCSFLTDHVLIKDSFDLRRFWYGRHRGKRVFLIAFFLNNIVTEVDTFITDIDRRTSNKLTHLVLTLPTKRADQVSRTIITVSSHNCSSPFFHTPARNHIIDDTVFLSLLTGEKEVPVGVSLDSLQTLAGVFCQDIVQLFPETQD